MKYPVCLLSHVITPGQYCVMTCDKDHVSEVMELEEKMKTETPGDDVSQFQLSYQRCVGVRDSEGNFKRGVIERKLKQDLFEVLLIDYGKIVQANISQIKLLPKRNFAKVEPLAFVVKLYGIIPSKYVSVDGARKARACNEWRPESKVFVQNLFKNYYKILVQSILIQERIVYGDIFVQLSPKKKFLSLRKLLCKNEFCAYSETFFLHQEGLDSFNEKKMKFVKKWQKENFGAVQSTFKFDSLASNTVSDLKDEISLKQDTDTSEEMEEFSEAAVAESNLEQQRIGMGRGKIKLLIAEMKKEVTSESENSRFFDSQSHMKVGSTASIGRGQLLRKLIESRKLLNSSSDGSHVGTSQSEKSSTKTSSDRLSSIDIPFDPKNDRGFRSPKSVSKAERAMRRYRNFSNSSEPPYGSLSSAKDESIIGNIKLEKDQKSTVLSDDRSFKSEFVKGKCLIKSASGSSKRTCKRYSPRKSEKSSSREGSKSGVKNVKLKDDVSERITTKERPSNQIPSSSCWAPYVLFEDSVVEPVKTFTDLPIKPSVIKNLEKGGTFGYLSQVQRWAIPAIRKQLNTVVIGSPKTGKTLSYIVPLIDYVQDESYFDELPEGNGPTVVIVASSSRVCESIYHLCHSLLGHRTKYEKSKSKVKVVLAHGNGCEKEAWVSLTNGCDILISTPPCLVRLLESPILTNFERLTCLVLDEIDTISQNPFRKHTRIILEKALFSAKGRHFQKIFCGERWTLKVQNLTKTYVNSYALVIGSYSEAVVYEGLKPCIYLADQNEKPQIMLDKLKDSIGEYKILVVCETTSEAIFLNEFLLGRGISPLLAHDSKMADSLNDIRDVWKSSREALLIATDGVLTELDVSEVDILVHFALPSKSKTNFYLRYLTLKSFLRDKRKFSKSENSSKELKDIILIDDENHHQLPHIVDFVVRLGGKVPTKILDKCQEIRRQIEIQKKNFPICENLLSLGRCRNQRNCSQRHAFVNSRDSPGRLPTSGWVNFVVLSTRNASCFSARLLEHVDPSGKTFKSDDHHLELMLKLSDFYKTESNQRSHGTPEIGDVCAVKTEVLEQEIFYRAKVIEYLAVDKYEKPLEVRVWLLDRGDVWKRKSVELYELPEELSNYPPVAVDVRILGLQPMDFDVSWSQIANNFTEDLMTRKLEEGQYWSGKIVLTMENTLFLNPIKRKQYLPHLNAHVFDLTVHDELLNNGIAILNNEHLPSLIKLCSEGGIEVVKEEEGKAEDGVLIQPQWAFFDEDFIEVKFLAAEHTSTVFLQPKKFEKVLAELEDDCQKEGEKTSGEIKKGKKGKAVAVGMFCLALFEDGKWNRGRIESENENEFYVFFVDHGDFLFIMKCNVVPISQNLLLRLPCQAIECGLVGIQEKEVCPMEVLEKIYDFSEDGKVYLYANIVRRDLKAKITNGRKYGLNLVNRKGISLNKMLVDCGMASAEESEKECLEDIQMDESDVEEEEEEEEEQEHSEEDIREEESAVKEVDNAEVSIDYFEGLADGLFEDEMAREFLKEFASKVLNYSESPGEKLPPVAGVNVPELSLSNSAEEGEEVSPKGTGSVQNVRRLLDLEKKRRSKTSNGPELVGREKVLTPQVLWCQNQMEVQMKILLGSVKDYCLECTVDNISFRCFSGEKFYGVDLRLYGAINPEMTKVTVKAFHVAVVLTKLTFPLWPRLHVDEGRLRWVNLDVESLLDKEGVFSDKIRAAKLEVESGLLKKGFRSDQILPCSDSEDSCEVEGDSDSEDSDHLD